MERQDWLRWRKSGIGASDCPIIMGDSPYSNIVKLYEEKISETIEEKTNYIMELGNTLEPIARASYEILNDNDFPPANFVHATSPHYRCSLDGYNEKLNKVIEIKYVGKNFTEECPAKYYAQIQYQYFITNCDSLDLVQINNMNKINIIPVIKDDEYIKKLRSMVDWFWECVTKKDFESVEAHFIANKKPRKKRASKNEK